MGGLGNQMFQYACGRRLSFLHKVPLLLDTSFFDQKYLRQDSTPREYELEVFKISAEIATKKITDKYYSSGIIHRFLRKLKYYRIILEEGRKMNEAVLSAPAHAYLEGYWQSEQYFNGINDIIRKEFTFPENSENIYVSELSDSIKNTNSVAIHIRRGDYVTNRRTNSVHGLLDMEYYSKAIDIMVKKLDCVSFYVFSDDPEWASKNFFKNIQATIINHQLPVRNYVDMKLMSYCMHNIIANSSYSWWGAWLNRNPGKIVIAPYKWYAVGNNTEVINYRIPDSWLTI